MAETAANPDRTPTVRRPFQFGLRAMFLAMACLSALFATISVVGPMWSTILVWFLVLAAAHVVGNRWGSQGWTIGAADEEAELDGRPLAAATIPPAETPATRLREATKLGRLMPLAASGGATAGGSIGVAFLVWLGFEQVGYAGIAVGGASAAVVGALLGFLASSFVSVARGAWQEAVEGTPRSAS